MNEKAHTQLVQKLKRKWKTEFSAMQRWEKRKSQGDFRDRFGNKVDPITWFIMSHDPDYYLVGHDMIEDRSVQTLWAGEDEKEFITAYIIGDSLEWLIVSNNEKDAQETHARWLFAAEQNIEIKPDKDEETL